MNVEIFLKETGGSVTNLITKRTPGFEFSEGANDHLDSIFTVSVEDMDGEFVRVDTVKKVFNSRITEVFQGSDLGEIIEEIFAHMKTQIKNLALANSRFVFDRVLFVDINFHKLNFTRGSSYLLLLG